LYIISADVIKDVFFVNLQVFPERQGKWKATTQSREFLKSIKRYYSNAYTDGEKQDAINLYYSFHLFYVS